MEFNDRIIEEGLRQILIIAQDRSIMLEKLKQALIENNSNKIIAYSRQICGLTDEKGN